MKISKMWIKWLVLFLIQIKIIAMEPAWYETSGGKRFLIDTEEKYDWYDAWNMCARYDALLVAIESEEKNHILMKLLKNVNEKVKNLWIGGNVFYDEIKLYWASIEKEFTFINWATDDVDKFSMQKKCVYLMRLRKNFPWDTANCGTNKFGFICEEMVVSEEVVNEENLKQTENVKGSMYNGSIYGLIG